MNTSLSITSKSRSQSRHVSRRMKCGSTGKLQELEDMIFVTELANMVGVKLIIVKVKC